MEFGEALEGLRARGPGRMIPDLTRIRRLADLLGEPQQSYPSVHVTGTNAKTSVARILTALCRGVGLAAGTYTSPHLQVVRERLSVAGRMIGEQEFADLYAEVAPLAGLVDDELSDDHGRVTYFELLTAMAFWWFADRAVEVGVFEVGLGGRWDATNLVGGDVAVLGPIDVDHAELLGATLEEVAEEKLGIVKQESALVTAPQHPEVMEMVRAVASQRARSLWILGEDVEVTSREPTAGGQRMSIRVRSRHLERLGLPLVGSHQADNAALAVAALAALTGESFEGFAEDLLRDGLKFVAVPGRLEIVDRQPIVLLDGAHNPHGARASSAALAEDFDFRTTVAVFACLGDKDLDGILSAYRGLVDHVIVTVAPSPRAAPLRVMREAAQRVWADAGVVVEAIPSVDEALTAATELTTPADGILVTGSLYTVGAARDRYVRISESGPEVLYEPEDVDDAEQEAAFERALAEMMGEIDEPGEAEADRPGE